MTENDIANRFLDSSFVELIFVESFVKLSLFKSFSGLLFWLEDWHLGAKIWVSIVTLQYDLVEIVCQQKLTVRLTLRLTL